MKKRAESCCLRSADNSQAVAYAAVARNIVVAAVVHTVAHIQVAVVVAAGIVVGYTALAAESNPRALAAAAVPWVERRSTAVAVALGTFLVVDLAVVVVDVVIDAALVERNTAGDGDVDVGGRDNRLGGDSTSYIYIFERFASVFGGTV